MKYCPTCKSFKISEKNCEDCGTVLLQYATKICPVCKSNNRIDLEKCIECGHVYEVEADINKARKEEQIHTIQDKSKNIEQTSQSGMISMIRKKPLLIFVGLIAGGILSFIIYNIIGAQLPKSLVSQSENAVFGFFIVSISIGVVYKFIKYLAWSIVIMLAIIATYIGLLISNYFGGMIFSCLLCGIIVGVMAIPLYPHMK